MRILLDECVHAGVRAAFPNHAVRTMIEVGWKGRKDKEFLPDAERAFDVFVTIDRKIEYENNLARFRLGFVIAHVKSNVITSWMPIFDQLLDIVETVKPGEIIHVGARRI